MLLGKSSTTLRIYLLHPSCKKGREKDKEFEISHLPSSGKKLISCWL